MNLKRVILAITLMAIVMMFIFVPTFTFHEENGLNSSYHFISNIPENEKINGPLILIEWLGVLLIAAALWSFVSSRESRKRHAENDNNPASNSTKTTDTSSSEVENPSPEQTATAVQQGHGKELPNRH